MGRPLNKRFFQGLSAAGFQIGCSAWFTGQGSAESGYIVQQKSNSKYRVESDAGPATRSEVLSLVEGAPTAGGEMQVTVTPENAQTPAEATFTFDSNGGVTAVTVTDGGYGYWADDTFTITTASGEAGNDDAVIAFTVSNGVIVSAIVSVAGTGYNNQTGASIASADVTDEAANPPEQSARIINSRLVKTFEGNTYAWNTTSPLGGTRGGFTEADLQETTS